jgi:hypothetical protein
MNVDPVDHRVGISKALAEHIAHREPTNHTLIRRIVHHQLIGIHRTGSGARSNSERIERGKGIGAELDSSPDLAKLMSLLEYLDGESIASER